MFTFDMPDWLVEDDEETGRVYSDIQVTMDIDDSIYEVIRLDTRALLTGLSFEEKAWIHDAYADICADDYLLQRISAYEANNG